MLVSVYTPTHSPAHLHETYASLCSQLGNVPFEWVLVPNGPVASVPTFIAADTRVRVCPSDGVGIGALKGYAVAHCRGDLYVELDHDDMLAPNCLATLADAVGGDEAVFAYSDCVSFLEDGRSEVFDPALGWESYPHEWRGHTWQAQHAFEMGPRSLAEISFAPHHVRAWTREAYRRAGGYNPALPAADDHDLLCRTYLADVRLAHVHRPLYYYRRHGGNSFLDAVTSEAIHRQSERSVDAYLHQMVAAWCRREGLAMVDLGGAHRCPEGFTPLDRDLPAHVVGHHLDVLRSSLGDHLGLGGVGCFRAVDFFEHLPGPQVPGVMNMLWDCLAHGGWLLTETPSVSDAEGRVGWGAFRDPTHVSFWCEDSWRYYTERGLARFVPEIRCRFQAVRVRTDYPSEDHRREHCPYVLADLCAHHHGPLPGGLGA